MLLLLSIDMNQGKFIDKSEAQFYSSYSKIYSKENR